MVLLELLWVGVHRLRLPRLLLRLRLLLLRHVALLHDQCLRWLQDVAKQTSKCVEAAALH